MFPCLSCARLADHTLNPPPPGRFIQKWSVFSFSRRTCFHCCVGCLAHQPHEPHDWNLPVKLASVVDELVVEFPEVDCSVIDGSVDLKNLWCIEACKAFLAKSTSRKRRLQPFFSHGTAIEEDLRRTSQTKPGLQPGVASVLRTPLHPWCHWRGTGCGKKDFQRVGDNAHRPPMAIPQIFAFHQVLETLYGDGVRAVCFVCE